jgi:hypothetical protein
MTIFTDKDLKSKNVRGKKVYILAKEGISLKDNSVSPRRTDFINPYEKVATLTQLFLLL